MRRHWEAPSARIRLTRRGSGRLQRFRGGGSLCGHLLNAAIDRHGCQQVSTSLLWLRDRCAAVERTYYLINL